MQRMQRKAKMNTKRLRLVLFVVPLVAAAALTVAADRSHPAGGGVIDPTCTSALPCIEYANNGSGPGIKGVGLTGNGVSGSAKVNSTSPSNGRAGVIGADVSSSGTFNSGVKGTSARGTGVSGLSSSGKGVLGSANSGTAVFGKSNSGIGLWGTSNNGTAIFGQALAGEGVVGQDLSSSGGIGVQGFSQAGNGVEGINAQHGSVPGANIGVLGLTFSTSITTFNPKLPAGGLFNSASGEGVVAESSGSQAETLAAANFGGGPIMRGYAGSTEIMELDNAGNIVITGTLTQSGTPMSVSRLARGNRLIMYSPKQAIATVEDVGETQLVLGQAYVRLDPRFAGTIDEHASYLVFLTPQGDTSGLYVAEKTAAGFMVREHGGRSNIAFDYRIVAKPFGSHDARLPNAPSLNAQGFTHAFTRYMSRNVLYKAKAQP